MKVTAEATIKLKIKNLGSWGDGWALDELQKSANSSVLHILGELFKGNKNIFLMENPKITTVMVEED